jgi:hypothetical protein
MSNVTNEDIDFLYWHAMNKMRAGNFYSAHQFFRYVMSVRPSFYTGLAMAYCSIRENKRSGALHDLKKITPTNPREQRLYDRLLKRTRL